MSEIAEEVVEEGGRSGEKMGWASVHILAASDRITGHVDIKGRLAPATARSYQIECLLYNVPDRLLGHSRQSAYSSALYWLRDNDLSRFFSQNKLVPLFDGGPDSWNQGDARTLIEALVKQYEGW